MRFAHFLEYFAGWAGSALGYILKALPKRLMNISLRRNIEQALIGLSVLDYDLGLAFDR